MKIKDIFICNKCHKEMEIPELKGNDREWTKGCGDKDLWDRFSAVIFIRDDGTLCSPDGFGSMYRDEGITVNTNRHGNWGYLNRKELNKRFKFISKKTGNIFKEFPKNIKIKK